MLGLWRAAGDGELGNRPHRGQGFTTKAMAAHGKQIVKATNFACGVLLHGKKKVVGRNAMPIVTNAYCTNTAVLKDQLNLVRLCIKGIFKKLLHHRGRPLHNLTCCNLAYKVLGKKCDACHGFEGMSYA